MLPAFPPPPLPGWAPTERAHLLGRAQTAHAILVDQPMQNDRPSAFPVNSADARQGCANAGPLSLSSVRSVRHCNLADGATLVGQKRQMSHKRKPGYPVNRKSICARANQTKTVYPDGSQPATALSPLLIFGAPA